MAVRYHNLVYDSSRWDGFRFRPDDIVISTPPKCGTTWTQMLCALLIFDSTTFDRPLARISPWLDMLTRTPESVTADLEAQTHRRFIKTHTPLDGLPFDERVTYLCVGRDPRDVAQSWEHHWGNIDMDVFMAQRAAAVGLDDLAEPGHRLLRCRRIPSSGSGRGSTATGPRPAWRGPSSTSRRSGTAVTRRTWRCSTTATCPPTSAGSCAGSPRCSGSSGRTGGSRSSPQQRPSPA